MSPIFNWIRTFRSSFPPILVLLSSNAQFIWNMLLNRCTIYTRFQGNYKIKIIKKKNYSPGGGHFDYQWKAENLVSWSPYSLVTSSKKLERSNNYFSSYRVNKNFFKSLTFDLWPCPWVKKCSEGLNVYMHYELNLLHHVGVVAKRVRAAAAAAAAHEGDDRPWKPIYTRFQGNCKKKIWQKKM